ncbi:MAG: hypothetical protein LW860_14735 [Xanthomonadaceae bacterium]|nr:hypothetical protein [Xanthomonadaceae bacterium]
MIGPATMPRRALPALVLPLLLSLALPAAAQGAASAQDPDGWSWVVVPYLWATSVETDLRDGASPPGTDSAFSDIVSKIDMALQLHVEAQGDRFGAFADVTYLALSDESSFANATSDASLDVAMIELAGVWNLAPEHYDGLDLFAGIRHIANEAEIRIDPADPAIPAFEPGLDIGLTDFMLGARYSSNWSERWGTTLRIDGAGGDTEGAINASALLRYRVGNGSWIFGYRYMQVELGEDERTLDLTLSGPVVAFSFGL